ncbi:MAG: hypothetical protein KGO96_07000 [Elusimicrobia bacterium]|nr:hypothetical protein [Elusimicrobiota bacterium]
MEWFDKSNPEICKILRSYRFDKNYLTVSGVESGFIGESIVAIYLLNKGTNEESHFWEYIEPSRKFKLEERQYKLKLTEKEYNVFPFLRKYKTSTLIVSGIYDARITKYSLVLEK